MHTVYKYKINVRSDFQKHRSEVILSGFSENTKNPNSRSHTLTIGQYTTDVELHDLFNDLFN